MSADNYDPSKLIAERVTKLEELFTHLQRGFGDLDQVVLEQQRQIDSLRKELVALSRRLEATSDVEAEDDGPIT